MGNRSYVPQNGDVLVRLVNPMDGAGPHDAGGVHK